MVIAEIDPEAAAGAGATSRRANIEQRKGDIENQKVQLEQDRQNLERTRQQVEKGLLNQQQLEQADLTVKSREAQIESQDDQSADARRQPERRPR